MQLFYKLVQWLSSFIPASLRSFIRSNVSLLDYDRERWRATNPFLDTPVEVYPESVFCLGIIEDISHYHRHYIAACREMKISYKVFNLLADDWLNQLTNSGCDAFLVWPSSLDTAVKQVFDYRLYILENDLNMLLYPSWKECWLTEHKPRLRDWMDAMNIPRPKTWVFHNRTDALDFAAVTEFPIILKTATGASATGVSVIHSRRHLQKMIHRAFGKGFSPRGFDANDRQRGFLFLQEVVPILKEWRLVRIGDSFFGHPKGQVGEFHSGSGVVLWDVPETRHLEFLESLTDAAGFKSMNVDVFEDTNGNLLVNELHTVFGASYAGDQLKVDGMPGRFVRQTLGGEWVFEPGNFCRNHLCNLRIEDLLEDLNAGVASS
jgi:hypothetical protein